MYTPASTATTKDIVENREYKECIRNNNRLMGVYPQISNSPTIGKRGKPDRRQVIL